MLDEGARLERLVQGMLVLARADEGALRLDVADVDLDDLLFAEARRLRDAGGVDVDTSGVAAGARARGRRPAAPGRAQPRPTTRPGTRAAGVAFAVAAADAASAVLPVDDDGDGIPPAERVRVFERFVRLDEARARDAGGSGLGLAIVREILRGHGGAVRVVEGPLGGARFEARLPL